MSKTKYLIIGSSHAGLSALDAIRIQDSEGGITLVTREEHLPYSPTILPYVVSGEVKPDKVFLRYEDDLDRYGVTFKRGTKVVGVDPSAKTVTLDSKENIAYEKLLLEGYCNFLLNGHQMGPKNLSKGLSMESLESSRQFFQ